MGIGGLVGGIINWWTHGHEFTLRGLGYFGAGAVVGALSALGGAAGAGAIAGASGLAAGVGVGAFTGAVLGIPTSLLLNGVNNILSGGDFGDNFAQSFWSGMLSGAISGGISGGIVGYNNALKAGKNVWWGGKPAYNGNGTYKSQYAFWNVDKPDVLNFESEPITKYLGDDMCVPSSYLSTHGEPHPVVTDLKEVNELDFKKLQELNNQGYTKAHLNVDNYEGTGHRMPVSKIKYVPNKYFKVESYDPGHMINVIGNEGTILRTYAPYVIYNLYNVPFKFNSFYLFP